MRGMRIHGGVAALLLISLLAGALAACGTTSEAPPVLDLNPYDIAFAIEPAVPAPGQPAVLSARVTGKQPLTKRAEISFEIKKIGADPREELPAARKDDKGLYSATYTFKEAARYSVTVHVITRSVHQVSNKEVEVK